MMMVDTGATCIALPKALASGLGVNVDELRFTVMIETATCSDTAARVTLDTVTVGPHTHQNVKAFVLDDLKSPLLGMSFLKLVKMSAEGDLLTLSAKDTRLGE